MSDMLGAGETEAAQRMRQEAEQVRTAEFSKVMVHGELLCRDSTAFENSRIEVMGEVFASPYFSGLRREWIEKVCFYLLTLDGQNLNCGGEVMAQLYRDFWGTAFIDAGFLRLKAQLGEERPDNFFSPPFGPGYFGMPLDDIEKFFRLFGEDVSGVGLTPCGTIEPEKTCTGLFFVLNRRVEFASACRECRGGMGGCSICSLRREGDV